MRRLAIAICVGTTLVGIAACSADEGDFKEEGESFINDNDEVEQFAGTDLSEAECAEPVDLEVGTTYECTSAGADGSTWRWTVEITGDNELSVQGGEPTN